MLPVLHHTLRFRCQTLDFRIRKLGHCERREDLFQVADQMALYHLYWHNICKHFEGDLCVRGVGGQLFSLKCIAHGQCIPA